MKMPHPLAKNHEEFRDGDTGSLNQTWGPSERRGHTPRKLRLSKHYVFSALRNDRALARPTWAAWR